MAAKAGGDTLLHAPPTKSRKRSRPSTVAVNDKDLISTLPDDILLHMFSFLDIKDVANTGALSRRWSSLWTQTSTISIDFESIEDYFFIEWFLLQCTSPLILQFHLLRLDYSLVGTFDLKRALNRWIRFAVIRGVKDMCIELYNDNGDEEYVLPRALLRCESLKSLMLRSCKFPLLRNGKFVGISWSSLRELCVHETKMGDGVINGVLERSPLLESVTLVACYGMNRISSFSRNMSELVIKRYRDPYYVFRNEEDGEEARHHKNLRLEINAPYLRLLRLLGRWEGKEVIVLKEVSSLVEVELNFILVSYQTNSDIIHGTMKGILNKLSYVDRFMFGNRFLMELHNYKGNGDLSLQLKCRHLTITTSSEKYSLGRIAGALELAPNVEKLVIDFVPKTYRPHWILRNKNSFSNNEVLSGTSWKSWTGRIKNIEITGFQARNDSEPIYWLSLIQVLLRDAHVLEEMVINIKWSWRHPELFLEEARAQDVLKVAEDILGCPRGSKVAKVILNCPFERMESSVRSS